MEMTLKILSSMIIANNPKLQRFTIGAGHWKNFIGSINPIGFDKDYYFYTFNNDFLRYTEIYIALINSDWCRYLKTFHSVFKNRSKERYFVKRLLSNYGSEPQNKAVDDMLTKKGIIFETSIFYS